ncbi:winged helix-turn-helix domain-containing protein [Plantactinospora sp. GCM10030261]|uniref:winged helix-turn-helix domain-containing protein n=1 Tax=Plantactinospora sp. GCM10030261 TaxID=3273420 RepID=UPI00362282BD
MSNGHVPFFVCVSSDAGVRQHVVRRLDDLGPVMLCADLAELRAMLFAVPDGTPAGDLPAGPAGPPPDTEPTGSPPATRFAVHGAVAESPYTDPMDAAGFPDRAVAGFPDRAVAGLVFGDLSVDPDAHLVTWRGMPLTVTRLERQLLARLVSPPVRLWTYERLFASVWGGAYLGDTAILHSAVKRLRRKLRGLDGGPQVQTVRGVGYRLAFDG